jgi:hypothetical protein
LPSAAHCFAANNPKVSGTEVSAGREGHDLLLDLVLAPREHEKDLQPHKGEVALARV